MLGNGFSRLRYINNEYNSCLCASERGTASKYISKPHIKWLRENWMHTNAYCLLPNLIAILDVTLPQISKILADILLNAS